MCFCTKKMGPFWSKIFSPTKNLRKNYLFFTRFRKSVQASLSSSKSDTLSLCSLRQHQPTGTIHNSLFNAALKLLSSSSSSSRNFSSFVLVFLSLTLSFAHRERRKRWRLINVDKEAIFPIRNRILSDKREDKTEENTRTIALQRERNKKNG